MKLSKIIFALLILSNIIGVTFVAKNSYKELLASEQEMLKTHSEIFKRYLESEIKITEILKQTILVNKGFIHEDDFYALSEILAKNTVTSSIAYIPDGIIKYLAPKGSGKNVVGRNVMTSPNDMIDSKKARDTNQIIVSGPYELFQGTKGIVIRNPVYYNDIFWGIVTVAMFADNLYESIGLPSLERLGFEYQLSKYTTNSSDETTRHEEHLVADRSDFFEHDHAVYVDIEVGSSVWKLALYAKDKTNLVASDAMFWFLIFLFINFILYYFITKFEQTKESLTRKLEFDALTGANSRLKLQQYYAQAKDIEFALFFIDLNKFKPVNDTYGHKVGDKLLKAYVERVRNEMKAETLIVRLGGDEFVILTPNVKDEQLVTIIKEKLIKISEIDFNIDSYKINISASIGTVLSHEADSLEALLTLADEKMYEQKSKRNDSR